MTVGSEIIERCGDKIDLLSGDDFTAFPLLSIGARGWISVTANVRPARLVEMFDAWERKDIEKARAIRYELLPLHRLMFIQSNPIPAKTTLAEMGLIKPFLRSPLFEMQNTTLEELRSHLKNLDIL